MTSNSETFTPKRPSFHIITFGCQMNEHDSELMAGILGSCGMYRTDNIEQADLVLINSCTIRLKAEEKAFSQAGRLKALKRERPSLKIGFCGCVAQRERERIFNRSRYIDFVFGTLNIYELSELVNDVFSGKDRICRVLDAPLHGMGNGCHTPLRPEPPKAWVKIMEGCNNYCTYCVVPYVRGRERSRQSHKIIQEVKLITESGYKEVTLLGQNVNSYGKDLTPAMDFSELLYQLNRITGLERIRFVTSHPKDLSLDLIHAIKECQKVCEHIHLPLQSGSDAILRKMNRGYTCKEYMEKLDNLKKIVPQIALTGDIICGFPGETEKDFEQTLKVIERIRYDWLFSFKYSPRPQTAASYLPDQLTEEVKTRRLQILQKMQNAFCLELNSKMLNREFPVLIEGLSKKSPNKLTGRTRTNKIVNIEGQAHLIGKVVKVKITRAKRFDLEGTII